MTGTRPLAIPLLPAQVTREKLGAHFAAEAKEAPDVHFAAAEDDRKHLEPKPESVTVICQNLLRGSPYHADLWEKPDHYLPRHMFATSHQPLLVNSSSGVLTETVCWGAIKVQAGLFEVSTYETKGKKVYHEVWVSVRTGVGPYARRTDGYKRRNSKGEGRRNGVRSVRWT